ncbi:hypothetical protein [Nesterenkonia aerolata]|uniref:Uncharacterized protein n=1 Tax=Nesterenkonia aerolata TaxID=3074079 RepID=A0ABU2DT29_9MICC|nr:hypothetical protein [Nesterenkonia sp. LY-0111]MDR8019667.1 hypothetical protein [Nesterenkonia sp. LY-0111]
MTTSLLGWPAGAASHVACWDGFGRLTGPRRLVAYERDSTQRADVGPA